MVMKAVRCHAFAGLEEVKEDNNQSESKANGNSQQRSKPKPKPKQFRPRAEVLPLSRVLCLDTIPRPSLKGKKAQVLIQTKFVGVQYPDALQAQGMYQVRPPLPYIPCMDVTGLVVDTINVGTNRNIQVGDAVLATLLQHGGTGGMAEYVVVPLEHVYKLPSLSHPTSTSSAPLSSSIDNLMSSCANIGRNYFAAYHSLKTIGMVGPGSLVLVDGASGGVGMATIELAKAMGATVIASVSTQEKMVHPQRVGADVVLTYGRTKESYRRFKQQAQKACRDLGRPNGVDLVVDMVNGDLFSSLVSLVRPLGTICLVGFTAGQAPIRPGLLLVKEVNVVGSIWGRWAFEYPEQHRQNVNEILEYIGSGKIQPRVDRIFLLSQYSKAFELFQNNQGRGNTVVSFDDKYVSETGAAPRSKL